MKTSKKHFKIFIDEFSYWQSFFQLNTWEISFTNNMSAREQASIAYDIEARHAIVNLAQEWDYEISEEEIRLTAFHEACELFFANAYSMFTGEIASGVKELNSEIHSKIHFFESTIYPAYKRRAK